MTKSIFVYSIAFLVACSFPTDPGAATANVLLQGDFPDTLRTADSPPVLHVTLKNLGRRTFTVSGICFSQIKITNDRGDIVAQGTMNNCAMVLIRTILRPNQMMQDQMPLPVLPPGRYAARVYTELESRSRFLVWSPVYEIVVK
jgi:hypothetical protein